MRKECKPMTAPNRAFLDALLKVAENPDQPGTVDLARLEQFLLRNEGITINGMKIVRSGKDANGEQTWMLVKEH
jgi:hypothetical protein